MIPYWLAFLVFLFGVGVGCVCHMRFAAEARRDEQIVDEALARSWRSGYDQGRGKF